MEWKPFENKFWLATPTMLVDEKTISKQVRGEFEALYISESGKSCIA